MDSSDADDRAAARLEASKLELEGRRSAGGLEAGVQYARETASYGELERLTTWAERRRQAVRGAASYAELAKMRLSGFQDLARVLAGSDEAAGEIDSRFRGRFGVEIDSRDWMASFVNGAIDEFKRLSLKIPVVMRENQASI